MKSTMCFINEVKVKYSKKPFSVSSITNISTACTILREVYEHAEAEIEVKEYFFMLLLNRANQVIGYHKLSEGGICGTVVDLRLAFATALKSLATGIILAHNHPSGNTNPSTQDFSITKKFTEAGKILDVQIMDHIILTSESYYSFAEQGTL